MASINEPASTEQQCRRYDLENALRQDMTQIEYTLLRAIRWADHDSAKSESIVDSSFRFTRGLATLIRNAVDHYQQHEFKHVTVEDLNILLDRWREMRQRHNEQHQRLQLRIAEERSTLGTVAAQRWVSADAAT